MGRFAATMAMVLGLLALGACVSADPGGLPPGQVATTQGIVAGQSEDGITSFRGIEYARAARWALPQPGPRWEGVKQADAFGPACPQAGQAQMVEDCLYLNVFAPSAVRVGARLPVVVWIHGGGFRAGQGGNGPRNWAREGVIVVTFNYRLGVLGFHDWPGWSQVDPRNFGQADMVAALGWVRDNIAAFGGDPRNVTIHGHSAGGMGVQLMMVDPRARGLFSRAIADAGYASWPFPAAMNPSPQMRMQMRYGPLEMAASPAELVARTPHFWLPYVGGADLAAQPSALFDRGQAARVGYLAGFNSYDGGGVLAGAGFTPETFLALFPDPAPIRAAYASDFAFSALQGAERLMGDRRYGLSTRDTARAMARRGAPVWVFHHDVRSATSPGSGHGAHVAALFGRESEPLRSALLQFVKTGSPNGPDLPVWPAFTTRAERWMVYSPAPSVEAGLMGAKLDLLGATALAP
jgi:para-nitrobenzyl esterase